jgi:hypothetical protein
MGKMHEYVDKWDKFEFDAESAELEGEHLANIRLSPRPTNLSHVEAEDEEMKQLSTKTMTDD